MPLLAEKAEMRLSRLDEVAREMSAGRTDRVAWAREES
ncbi:hypothetical protein HDA32_003712 [Spinactinospora alkalitolerans]|uniref:Uncharacterized protein n=1 Tax=Spinactinospora alkalitolerans TaxID=687207 RepID=A0A852TZV0_9ACTN|nr:hypothetical protein [Spinactinospora alkalitolerans]